MKIKRAAQALDLHPVVDWVMFGSDWPVCLLAAGYEEVVVTTRNLVTNSLGKGAEPAVFGGNAARFYGIDRAID